MKLPSAILFDHDGVLVASEALHWEAWGELLKELKISYDPAQIRAMVGKTAPQILARVLDTQTPGWSQADFDLEALSLRKNDFYLELSRKKLKPYPGVQELLLWLQKKGVRRAVVSNAKSRELITALTQLELFDLFDEVISRDDIHPPKPDPMPYLFAAARLQTPIEDCLVVEDSPPGLEAGLMAKIPTAAVMTNFSREILEAPVPGRPDLKPVWIGPSIELLAAWLETL